MKYLLTLLLAIITLSPLRAQGYFKQLEQPTKSYHRKVLPLLNGNTLLGDASQEALTHPDQTGIYLTCLDPCGKTVWSKRYQWEQNYLELSDLVLQPNGNVVLMGRAYQSPREYVFLMKITPDGKMIQFVLHHGNTVDLATYSLRQKGNHLLVCGLLLDWVTLKEGFLAEFDEGLNYISGTKIFPFESEGVAFFNQQNGITGRSERYHFSLDDWGHVQWAVQAENIPGAATLLGPIEVDNGTIFEFYSNGYAFFYQLDLNGQLLWQSPKFPSVNHAAALTVLDNGQILATYGQPNNNKTRLCRLRLHPDGSLSDQYQLMAEYDLHTGLLDQQVTDRDEVFLLANPDVFSATAADGLLLEYPLDSLSGRCYQWEPIQTWEENDVVLVFQPVEMTLNPLVPVPSLPSVVTTDFTEVFTDICPEAPEEIRRTDSLLLCGQNWLVALPNTSFKWTDGVFGTQRWLEKTGIYTAVSTRCEVPITLEYQLQRADCPCPVFLPNVFSPDDDGRNDGLRCYPSNCDFLTFQMRIYNRWGEIVFVANTPETAWNGDCNHRPAPAGVYVMQVNYTRSTASGAVEHQQLIQDVTLIR